MRQSEIRSKNQSKLDERIHQVLSEFKLISPFFAGYPVNHDFDYSALYPLMEFPANNVGDPLRPLALPDEHARDRARSGACRR